MSGGLLTWYLAENCYGNLMISYETMVVQLSNYTYYQFKHLFLHLLVNVIPLCIPKIICTKKVRIVFGGSAYIGQVL